MTLRLETRGRIAHLLIDRADKRNAMNQAMWRALPDLVAAAMADDAVRVLVLRAADPGAFCAGADIAEFAVGASDAAWRSANQAAIARAQFELARAHKPTIAAVAGDCVGAGCGLALACDLRIATPKARFGITPAKLGLVYPLHDTKLLVDLVGPAQAKRILFTAQLIDAAEAHRIGLVDMIGADVDALAETIAGNSLHATIQAKAIVRRILDGQSDDDDATRALFEDAFTGPDFEQGARAFLEKRAPQF